MLLPHTIHRKKCVCHVNWVEITTTEDSTNARKYSGCRWVEGTTTAEMRRKLPGINNILGTYQSYIQKRMPVWLLVLF